MYFVYIISDLKNRLYVGVSGDPKQRLYDHNHKAGASFTSHGNFKIVFLEKYSTLKEARSREVQIKKWRREKKNMLIERFQKSLPTKPIPFP